MPDLAMLQRLHEAFALLRAHRDAPTCTDAEFVAAHPHLADVLTPLLRGDDTRTLFDSFEATDANDATRPMEQVAAPRRELPSEIGPFRILSELGDGGMGVVYLAEQTEPVRRLVALKRVKHGLASDRAISRFEAERQALALMNHPNVARVYEAGHTEDGLPWVAMEYVPGEPITEYCDRHRLDTQARLDLFLQVCDGVHHAHQKALIHRDLKPSNVLVAHRDGVAIPSVIDFGIAKPLGHRLTDQSIAETGHLVGTPEYMSPEQLTGASGDLDTRSDVYALGLVLYELLSGHHPVGRDRMRDASLAQITRIVTEEDPLRPSVRAARGDAAEVEHIADRRGTNPLGLVRALRGDLDWIVLAALEKQPDARYSSVQALAEDIRRFRRHEPITARAQTTGYVLRRFMRRRRGLVAALAVIGLTLTSGLVTVSVFAKGESEARQEYAQLSTLVHLERAVANEEALHPAWPATLPRLRSWLVDEAQPILAKLPSMRAALANVTARSSLAADGNRTFANAEDEFLFGNLTRLIADIEQFEAGLVAEVRARADWAEQIELRSIEAFAAEWDAAIHAIARADGVSAHEAYGALGRLTPQIGLVPIGMNPVTRLWEFWHLASANRGEWSASVRHDSNGVLHVDADAGIVFVLVPPGTLTMGAQTDDPTGPSFDASAQANEQPPHAIQLAAFFIARHELTQAQWMRLGDGSNPSYTAEQGKFGRPVESIAWADADRTLRVHGLALPTEAQWEYACRAGSSSVWWSGDERESLIAGGIGLNIADQSARRLGARWREIGDWESLDDGFPVHAEVAAGRPNPWGLHFVCGNVLEWCRDEFLPYSVAARDGDGLRAGEGGRGDRCCRGGSFMSTASSVRSANRDFNAPTNAINLLGVRAMRPVLDRPE